MEQPIGSACVGSMSHLVAVERRSTTTAWKGSGKLPQRFPDQGAPAVKFFYRTQVPETDNFVPHMPLSEDEVLASLGPEEVAKRAQNSRFAAVVRQEIAEAKKRTKTGRALFDVNTEVRTAVFPRLALLPVTRSALPYVHLRSLAQPPGGQHPRPVRESLPRRWGRQNDDADVRCKSSYCARP